MKTKKIIVWGLAALYTVSPIDLVPDPIPILGWLDDVAVIIAAAAATRK